MLRRRLVGGGRSRRGVARHRRIVRALVGRAGGRARLEVRAVRSNVGTSSSRHPRVLARVEPSMPRRTGKAADHFHDMQPPREPKPWSKPRNGGTAEPGERLQHVAAGDRLLFGSPPRLCVSVAPGLGSGSSLGRTSCQGGPRARDTAGSDATEQALAAGFKVEAGFGPIEERREVAPALASREPQRGRSAARSLA
ncbi:MAG: hypothetical protein RJA16_428 [Planctomycetota bacterium]